jgi:Holliday junction resolvase-like predicted endonuclease
MTLWCSRRKNGWRSCGVAAVDQHKRRQGAVVVRDYLGRFPPSCQWRFDVVSVYYEASKASQPQIELFSNSSLTA